MAVGRASRTAARLKVGSRAGAEPRVPEVGLEGSGLSPSHSEHLDLLTLEERVMNHTRGYFQTLALPCSRPHSRG